MESIAFRKSHLEAVCALCKDLQEATTSQARPEHASVPCLCVTPEYEPGTPQPGTSVVPHLLLGQAASRP